MKTLLEVLSRDERHRIHEASLDILETTGVRMETDLGRQILKDAGALVDDRHKIVKFPKTLVESSLEQITRDFNLGARRPGHDLVMNKGNSTLCLDEIGVFWCQVEPSDRMDSIGGTVDYLCRVFRNFSKHVQEGVDSADEAPWYLEILQTIFGTKEEIRKNHPVSWLLCPQSPLSIDKTYTDAYLATKGWNIPVGIMPMPLMGASAPGNMISTIIQGNCEILSMICLLQANEPGVAIIYAPALAVMNPRTAAPAYASMEYSIMDSAATEMARYYGMPSEASPGGSDAQVVNIQNGYECAAMDIPTILSRPDIVVGPGMLDGSMVSSLEKILIDVEIFRLARHAQRGVNTHEDMWLTDVIKKVGPGGTYLYEESTVKAVRSDDWYISDFGFHETYEHWQATGEKGVLEEAHEKVNQMLKTHAPLPLGDDVEKELEKICKRAAAVQR